MSQNNPNLRKSSRTKPPVNYLTEYEDIFPQSRKKKVVSAGTSVRRGRSEKFQESNLDEELKLNQEKNAKILGTPIRRGRSKRSQASNLDEELRLNQEKHTKTPGTPGRGGRPKRSQESNLDEESKFNLEKHTKTPGTPGRGGRPKRSQKSNLDEESKLNQEKSTKIPEILSRRTRAKKVIEEPKNNDNQVFNSLKADLEKELESIEEEIPKPTALFNDEDISGNRIYGFQTPVKKNAMTEKALLSRTPSVPKTPISSKKKKSPRILLERIDKSSHSPNAESQQLIMAKNTRSARKRQVHFSSESESVSEDSEFVPSSESDTDTEENVESDVENKYEGNVTPKKKVKNNSKKVHVPITPCRRGRSRNKIVYEDYHLKTDEYFETQGEKILTSDHTLGRLKTPRLDEGKLQELLKHQNYVPQTHKQGIYALNENHKSMFAMWYHILEEGFSLLLHGLGSKRNLINDFHKEVIVNHPTLIINGFFPSLTIKDILDGIITELLELECPANPNDCFNLIEEIMNANPEDRLYLLIHNIDGPMLRSNKAQDILSRLASVENIHIVASVDHINAPLILDNIKRARYNFYWWDATTLLPYEAETSYESSLLIQRSGALALSSLNNVFASLTTNAKAIYTILVKYQLENGKSNVYPGMAFKDLYRSAREGFLVSSDISLRAQLTEFLDHKLVRTKRNVDGAEYLDIPLDNSLLQKFLEDHET